MWQAGLAEEIEMNTAELTEATNEAATSRYSQSGFETKAGVVTCLRSPAFSGAGQVYRYTFTLNSKRINRAALEKLLKD